MARVLLRGILLIATLGLLAVGLNSVGFFDRQIGNLEPQDPPKAQPRPEGDYYVIKRSSDGFFYVDAWVNDDPVDFLVDTGASHVILSRDTAYGLGIDLWDEEFDKTIKIANGNSIAAASITLDSINIGDDIIVYNVLALVVDEGDTNFLGMSFLNRIRSFRVEGEQMILVN